MTSAALKNHVQPARHRLDNVFLLVLAICCGVSRFACADDAPPPDPLALFGGPYQPPAAAADKSAYNLFDPVPDDDMRVFATDRPGKTHSASSLDAGHYQVESDIVTYAYDRNSPGKQTDSSLTFGAPLVKAGLTDRIDLEMGFALYNEVRATDRPNHSSTYASGFGDLLLGGKLNLFGNGGARQALALLPFVKFPTAAPGVGNGVAEYSLNAPYELALDDLWSITLEPAVASLKNDNSTHHHGDYQMLANLNRPLIWDTVTAAVEIASEYDDSRQATPRYTFDPSLQWLVTPAFQLDAGAYFGLNKAATDYNPYVGASFRF